MTEDTYSSEEGEYFAAESTTSEEESTLFEQMLEVVTGETFTQELHAFGETHAGKFSETEECSHEQFEVFRKYRELIEHVIDREMTDLQGKPFSCAAVAARFSTAEKIPSLFEEVADVLNSLNDFLAFKTEMLAHLASRDKQDLVVTTVSLSKAAAGTLKSQQARSQRIRNCN